MRKLQEGWVALPERYDDYGYSGGDLNRPAYRRLMEHCEQGLIDKIIVFRIDRMSRSHCRPIRTKHDFMTPYKTSFSNESISCLLSA